MNSQINHGTILESQTIVFEDLIISVHLGITATERNQAQPVHVNMILTVDAATNIQDDIANVLNYDLVYQYLHKLAIDNTYQLQETLCATIAKTCLELPQVLRADIHVSKPEAYSDCRQIGVRQVWSKA